MIANHLGTAPLSIGQVLIIPEKGISYVAQAQPDTRSAGPSVEMDPPSRHASTVLSDDSGSETNSAPERDLKAADLSLPIYNALIIGINEYTHWQDLKEARHDAETVAQVLKKQYGFTKITSLYDKEATTEKIEGTLRLLVKNLSANDALLIYYSGHGYFDRLLKKGYWIPTDGREQINGQPATTDWFNNTNLKEYIAAIQAKHVLVISDSCFSGSLFRGSTLDLSAKKNAWYRRAIAQPSRWAISSGDLETVPDSSIFARKVKDCLVYPKQDIFSASDLSGWLKMEVATATGSQPLFGPIADPGQSLQGEFVFIRQNPDASPTNAPAATPAVK
jgi:hypothetical protein